jgi:hypothetical protein
MHGSIYPKPATSVGGFPSKGSHLTIIGQADEIHYGGFALALDVKSSRNPRPEITLGNPASYFSSTSILSFWAGTGSRCMISTLNKADTETTLGSAGWVWIGEGQGNGPINISFNTPSLAYTSYPIHKVGIATPPWGFANHSLAASNLAVGDNISMQTIPSEFVGVEGSVGVGTLNEFGSGDGVLGIGNATTPPPLTPTGGGVMFVEGGALKYKGSSGTVTTIANS